MILTNMYHMISYYFGIYISTHHLNISFPYLGLPKGDVNSFEIAFLEPRIRKRARSNTHGPAKQQPTTACFFVGPGSRIY